MTNLSPQEAKLLEIIRNLDRYQKVEVKRDDQNNVVYTFTTNVRGTL